MYVQKEKVKKQSQDQKPAPKGEFPKHYTFPAAGGPLASPHHRWSESQVLMPHYYITTFTDNYEKKIKC